MSGVSRGDNPSTGSEAVSLSEIGPLDYERNGGGTLRLDVSDLVRSWLDGSATNYGRAIVSKNVGTSAFLGRASEATLVIRYGVLPQ